MQNVIFYVITIMIWGSSWFVINFQLGVVHPVLSVAYRYIVASVFLFVFLWIFNRKKETVKLTPKDHFFMALQGFFLFCVNYSIFYMATGYIPSGLVAVVFCLISVMNIVNQAIFYRKKVERTVLFASILGLIGISLVFLPEMKTFSLEDDFVFGLGLCLIATYSASLGNMLAIRNNNRGISVNTYNKWGMLYGAVGSIIIVLVSGIEINMDWRPDYLISLVYLALFASVIGFGCYLTLVKNIGADRAAYVAVLFPIVALTVSTLFEGYVWKPEALVGVLLILSGNLLIIVKPERLIKWLRPKAA